MSKSYSVVSKTVLTLERYWSEMKGKTEGVKRSVK